MRSLRPSLLLVLLLSCGGDADDDGRSPEICDDGEDNDLDGYADCEDSDCYGGCLEDCRNGVDDNDDGRIDCLDPQCFGGLCSEICDDGGDNDLDGAIDCDDSDCLGSCAEVCDDGIDNDGDEAVDCDDPDCAEACATGGDADTDSDADSDTDTDVDVDTADTGSSSLDPTGTYVGTVQVDVYSGPLLLDSCLGNMTVEIDPLLTPQIASYGSIAACSIVPYGVVDVTGSLLTQMDAQGTVFVDVPSLGTAADTWFGTVSSGTITGAFAGTISSFDYEGQFTATR